MPENFDPFAPITVEGALASGEFLAWLKRLLARIQALEANRAPTANADHN